MATCLQQPPFWRPYFNICYTNLPLNNDQLLQKTKILGSKCVNILNRTNYVSSSFFRKKIMRSSLLQRMRQILGVWCVVGGMVPLLTFGIHQIMDPGNNVH
jgi:hypothetical protein